MGRTSVGLWARAVGRGRGGISPGPGREGSWIEGSSQTRRKNHRWGPCLGKSQHLSETQFPLLKNSGAGCSFSHGLHSGSLVPWTSVWYG